MQVYDETASVNVVWYNNKYIKNSFSIGKRYIFCGKVQKRGRNFEILNPVFEDFGANKYTGKIIPV